MAVSLLLKVFIALTAVFGAYEAKKSRHERQVPSLLFSGTGASQVASSGLGGYQQSFSGHLSHHDPGRNGGSIGVFQSSHGGIPAQFTRQVDVLHGPLAHTSHFEGSFGSVGGFGTTGSIDQTQIHRAAAEHHHLSRKAQTHTQIAHAAMAQAEAVQDAQLQAAAAEKHLIRKAIAHHTAAQQAQTAANSAQQRLLHASATRQALLQASASRAAAVLPHPLGVRQGLFRGHYGAGNLYSKSISGVVGQYGGAGFQGAGSWNGATGYHSAVPWHRGLTYHGPRPWYGGKSIHATGSWYDTTGIHGTGTLYNGGGVHGSGTLLAGAGVHRTGMLYGGTTNRGAGLILPGSVTLPSGVLNHVGQHMSGLDLQTTHYGQGGLYGHRMYGGEAGVTPLMISRGIMVPEHGFEAKYGAVGVGLGHQVGGIPHGHTVSKIKKCTSIHAIHNVHSGQQQYQPVTRDLQSYQSGLFYGDDLVIPHSSHSLMSSIPNSFSSQTSLRDRYGVGNTGSGFQPGFERLRTAVGLGDTLAAAH